MNTLRDAVRQVQRYARQADISALDNVLRDGMAERGARLAAANYLARAGEPGLTVLRAVMTETNVDGLGRHAAFARLRETGKVSPEERPVRWSGDAWKIRADYFDKPELRALLREPYRSTPRIVHKLPFWLKTLHGDDWCQIVRALGQVPRGGYASVIPSLVKEMGRRHWDDTLLLPNALANLGSDDLPFLFEALNRGNASQRRGLALALERIGDPSAIKPLEQCLRPIDPHRDLLSVQASERQLRQSLESLRQRNPHN